MGAVRIAVVQMRSGSDVGENERAILRLLHYARDRGAQYIQFPEYCTYWGPRDGYAKAAKKLDDEFIAEVGREAQAREVTVHLGSVLEPASDGRFFNTSVIIGPDGHVGAIYRKVHLFDAQPPGGVTYLESLDMTPGQEMTVVEVGEMCLGLSICFDVRFAELYRALALAGAQVLAVPAAFSTHTGPAHWEVLLRARAIEEHAYVLAAAQVGTTSDGLTTHGHSMVVSPWGEILVEATGDGEEVLIAEIDVHQVSERRAQIEVLRLRRPTVYQREVLTRRI